MRLTVVPSDSTIIMDGQRLVFPFAAPSNLHAIQWYGTHGFIETTDSKQVRTDDMTIVQQYVTAYTAEAARLAAIASTPKTTAEIAAETSAAAMRELAAIDAASVRSMREWIAAQPSAPQKIKDHEAAAGVARAKL